MSGVGARVQASSRLAPDLDAALQTFAGRASVVVGLDFDGVLAPIVLDPTTSRMLPASGDAVARLTGCTGVEVAVVSGRDAADVAVLTALPPGTRIIGSHGAEWSRSTGDGAAVDPLGLTDAQATLLEDLRRQTQALADDVAGAWVQRKPTAVVLHTRPAAPEEAAELTRRVLRGPAAGGDVHVVVGKEVVEMAVVAVTKGDALRRLRTDVGANAVLYAGDDTTDEDAFAALDADAGDVAIKVGPGPTAAQFRVADLDEMSAVLTRLAELCAQRPPTVSGTDSSPPPNV